MTLSNKEFADLCDEFMTAVDNKVNDILERDYDITDQVRESSDIKIMSSGLAGVAKTFAKVAAYSLGTKLPGALGGNYFENKLKQMDEDGMGLGTDLAEMEAGMLLNDGIAPQRIAEKMPAALKTEAALEIARKNNMPNIAKLIETGLNYP